MREVTSRHRRLSHCVLAFCDLKASIGQVVSTGRSLGSPSLTSSPASPSGNFQLPSMIEPHGAIQALHDWQTGERSFLPHFIRRPAASAGQMDRGPPRQLFGHVDNVRRVIGLDHFDGGVPAGLQPIEPKYFNGATSQSNCAVTNTSRVLFGNFAKLTTSAHCFPPRTQSRAFEDASLLTLGGPLFCSDEATADREPGLRLAARAS
jgi:hypothetical protein